MKIANRSAFIMSVTNALYWATIYSFVPILPSYAKAAGASVVMIGLINGSYGLFQLFARLPLGILSDRMQNRKGFILFGSVVGLISVLGLYLFPNPTGMLIFRALSGLSACFYVQISVLYGSYFTDEKLSHAMGTLAATCSGGQALVMLLGGFVNGRAANYDRIFYLGIGMGVIAILFSSMVKETSVQREPIKLRDLASVALDKPLLISSLLAVFVQSTVFGKAFTFSPLAAEVLHANVMQKNIITMMVLLPSVLFSSQVGKRMIPAMGTRNVCFIGFLMLGLSCAIAPWCNNFPLLYTSQFITGVGNALTIPALMAFSAVNIAPEKRSTAMGFFQAVYSVGIFLGPWINGVIVDSLSINASFIFNALLGVVSALLSLALISGNIGRVSKGIQA